jgi:hypothetical protein
MKYVLGLASALAIAMIALPAHADNMNSMGGTTSSGGVTPKDNGGLSMSTTFAPNPPHQGPETITVMVKDATGKPVKGAKVKIATNMPSMSMPGPTLTAQDNGDGTYSAQTNLNYSTMWTFTVTASAKGKSGGTKAQANVK